MTTRMIVLEALQSGPKSVNEIAQALGRKYGTIRNAVELLEAKGLIQEIGKRPSKTKPETLFEIRSAE